MPDQPDWIGLLRQQAQAIATGDRLLDAAIFADAPADIAALSGDLAALALAMAERDAVRQALTHEVHHRVKNNLQIVSSLLNMQASRSRIPTVRQALGQTRARMDALALIHRLLYEKEDDGTRGTIDSARLISELCAQLRHWHKDRASISFVWDVTPFAVPLDSAVPLALLTVEAITNAYAHAFPQERAGEITLVSAVGRDNCAHLVITDDGVGYGGDGAVPERGCMGLALMEALASQLGSRLEVTSEGGTSVRLDYRIRG